MMTILLALTLPLISPPQSDVVKNSRDSDPITLRGCLHGKTLKVTRSDDPLGPETKTFSLHLSKALATALREHEGHEEEITGVLRHTARAMGGTKSKVMNGGKTKVTVGATEERNTGPDEGPPQIDVTGFRHMADLCEGR
jgi:hypothetical protein